mmetsp:Transcript_31180/g.87421  ORF Transcript_31180/g.87421 Transcript_31180/m.87421 type:complete len:195 (+) Transcript_31180:108-692(+)
MTDHIRGLVGAGKRSELNRNVLERLGEFKHIAGWMDEGVSRSYYDRMLADVPFAKKRWNVLYVLPQKAYNYELDARQSRPIPVLEEIIAKVGTEFPELEVTEVWCNLLCDPSHHLDWHQDQYGEHLFVLSFGAPRRIEYRDHKTKADAVAFEACSGDLYYMHPAFDKRHDHRVLKSDAGDRISLAMFATVSDTT